MKKQIKTNNAPQAIGPYNQAVISGNFIFVSGQIPLTPEGKLSGNTIEEQTKQCLVNIEGILKEAGLGRSDIIKTTLFIKNMDDFQKVNEIYSGFFEGTVYPARSTVEVSRLPKDVLIEIESIAAIN